MASFSLKGWHSGDPKWSCASCRVMLSQESYLQSNLTRYCCKSLSPQGISSKLFARRSLSRNRVSDDRSEAAWLRLLFAPGSRRRAGGNRPPLASIQHGDELHPAQPSDDKTSTGLAKCYH